MVEGRFNSTRLSGTWFPSVLFSRSQYVFLPTRSKQTHQLHICIPLGKEREKSSFLKKDMTEHCLNHCGHTLLKEMLGHRASYLGSHVPS